MRLERERVPGAAEATLRGVASPGNNKAAPGKLYEEPGQCKGMDQQMDRQMSVKTLIRKMRNEAGKVVSQQDG